MYQLKIIKNSLLVLLFILFSPYVVAQTSGPEQDCFNAVSVCQDIYVQNESYVGSGDTDIIPPNSCLLEGENNTVWYIFTVSTPGVLEFSIIPFSLSDDYDFALYDITGLSCSDIFSGVAEEVRCNYSSILGETGLQDGFTGTSEPFNGPPFSAPLNVNAGETFALVVDNFTSSEDGYTLDFSASTAEIIDNTPPEMQEISDIGCTLTETIELFFSEPVTCESFAANGSNFSLSGPQNVNIVGVSAPDCDDGGGFTSSIILELDTFIFTQGTYTLQASSDDNGNFIEDNCGNPLSLGSLDFSVPEIVFADFDYTISTGCFFDTIRFTNQSVGTINSYEWTFGNVDTSTDFEPELIIEPGEVVNVTLEVVGNTCTNSKLESISLSSGFQADFSIAHDNACASIETQFLNTSAAFTNSWFWDFGEGTTSTEENPAMLFDDAGTYDITFIASNTIEGCLDTLTKTVEVHPNLEVDFTLADGACSQQAVTFNADISGTPENKLWEMGDGTTYTDISPTHVFSSAGSYSVSLAVQDVFCGSDTIQRDIEILPSPEISLGNDTSVCFGTAIELTPAFVSAYDQISWSSGAENTENISLELTNTETIVWAEVSQNNCVSSDTIIVRLGGDNCPLPIVVPNAFSPDGESTNDRFRVVADFVKDFEMRIYNRWGQLLFYTENVNEGWDGTYRDINQPLGAYVYEIRVRFLDGQNTQLSGNVTLIR